MASGADTRGRAVHLLTGTSGTLEGGSFAAHPWAAAADGRPWFGS